MKFMYYLRIPYRIPFSKRHLNESWSCKHNDIEDLKKHISFILSWKNMERLLQDESPIFLLKLNDEAPSKGEEKNVFYRSHENGKREILLEKISPFYLCCLQDMSLNIYKHFKTMLMFIVSYIHTPFSINGVTSKLVIWYCKVIVFFELRWSIEFIVRIRNESIPVKVISFVIESNYNFVGN